MKNIPNILVIVFLCVPILVSSQSIVTTKHNLSASGPGTVKATIESEVCIFCHTPHERHYGIKIFQVTPIPYIIVLL